MVVGYHPIWFIDSLAPFGTRFFRCLSCLWLTLIFLLEAFLVGIWHLAHWYMPVLYISVDGKIAYLQHPRFEATCICCIDIRIHIMHYLMSTFEDGVWIVPWSWIEDGACIPCKRKSFGSVAPAAGRPSKLAVSSDCDTPLAEMFRPKRYPK